MKMRYKALKNNLRAIGYLFFNNKGNYVLFKSKLIYVSPPPLARKRNR